MEKKAVFPHWPKPERRGLINYFVILVWKAVPFQRVKNVTSTHAIITPISTNEASNQTTCIKYLPSGTGSIHNLPRSLGTLSACASLWACFSSLLSLANALWVMAARCKEPSGFCVTRITRHVYGLMQNEELENSKLCSPSRKKLFLTFILFSALV